MKAKITSILLIIFYFNLYGQSTISNNLSKNEVFSNLLKSNNLSYSLPNGYIEIDTSFSKKYFLFLSFRYTDINQIQSTNGNVKIYPNFLKYDKKAEDNLKRLFPDRNIDMRNDHLNVIRKLISDNNKQSKDTISFNIKDIHFYAKKDLRKLGADIAGDYTMKLASSYEGEYNYVTYRFIGKYYNLWIYEHIFYIEYDPKIAKKTLKETLFLFRFKTNIGS